MWVETDYARGLGCQRQERRKSLQTARRACAKILGLEGGWTVGQSTEGKGETERGKVGEARGGIMGQGLTA